MAQQLRFRALFAGTAIAALALTGCGQGGGDSFGSESSASPEAATAYPRESKEAADQHVSDLRDQQDLCGEISVSVMEEGDQDLGSALSDIARTFVDGPAEPSEGASESASEEASDSQS